MDQENPVTVSELTLAIKMCLEPVFPRIFLRGEISNFKRQSSGHLYFSLKDSESQIAAVMFRGSAALLQNIPKEGDQVTVKGEIKIYPPRGSYQIVVKELEFAGLGELLLKLEELKRKIHNRGWFSSQHKKPIPKMPRRIGIITSPTGAAVRDILNVLSRRFGGVHPVVYPVKVQGEGAAEEIARAVDDMNRYQFADVIILGRGGGCIEDLWAFNQEIVAEAVFRSEIPIVCAVGHETDHTIAEYVADLRAPTPSAAAEIVVAEKEVQLKHLYILKKRLAQSTAHLLRHAKNSIKSILRQPVLSSPYALLGQKMQILDDLRQDVELAAKRNLIDKRVRLDALGRQLASLNPVSRFAELRRQLAYRNRMLLHAWRTLLQRKKEKAGQAAAMLQAIDPKNLLKNGYSILFSKNTHSVINSVYSLKKGETVKLLFSDGEAEADVQKIFPHSSREEAYGTEEVR